MSKISETETLHHKEADFHDQWAESVDLKKIRVREAFEAPAAMESKHILKQMGNLQGKRVLDIGAGLGESSVYFALLGADVTYTDISPGMLKCALGLAQLHGVRIKGIVSLAESLDLADASYDIVYIANVIHHVPDKEVLFREVRRLLKPGGRFFSIDPLAYNPIINVYRRMATAVRSEDETPLTVRDIALARRYFSNVRHREFWIATLVLFLKYYLIDRIHPNEDRYWKRIFSETERDLFWWQPLRVLDAVLTRVPLFRLLAWNIVMWGEKPVDANRIATN